MLQNKKIVGRKEIAHFPELKLKHIHVKMDTGAYTSSMHCHSIVERDGRLYCNLLDPGHHAYKDEELVFEHYKQKKVRSSNGAVENRYKIASTIELLGESYKIDLTLTDRQNMKTPVLIGRKFLNKKFIVDVAKKYTHL
ncbi:Uncharacterized conserved protein [Saccharicrinis carchari]|uniref:Uncharacterized conserved protein n=1 Tax=Saccharicrinis carchari TaxID=1168039 RepID=A0A521BZV5_SACCC|nr:RimK/LysX family protein [Saccharicrinis carchari]SMO52739.1 Uncharacterized conserved protein [Saccharicrinis carchari]